MNRTYNYIFCILYLIEINFVGILLHINFNIKTNFIYKININQNLYMFRILNYMNNKFNHYNLHNNIILDIQLRTYLLNYVIILLIYNWTKNNFFNILNILLYHLYLNNIYNNLQNNVYIIYPSYFLNI